MPAGRCEAVLQAAGEIAAALEGFSAAAIGRPSAVDVHLVMEYLKTLGERFPDALNQLAAVLALIVADGSTKAANGSDSVMNAVIVEEHLSMAAGGATDLVFWLDQARTQMPLTHPSGFLIRTSSTTTPTGDPND